MFLYLLQVIGFINKLIIDLSNISINKYRWVIIILTFIIYGNSINNEYALDDNIVVEGNKTVEEGLSGIPMIFKSRYSTDKKQTYDYRPLVITTFAIEKQFFSKFPEKQSIKEKAKKDKLTQANISHFVNVLLYGLLCIVLFNLLIKIMPEYHIVFPFLITIIFLIHPIHTEVVCSLKNRDEMLMLIGMLFSLHFFIKFNELRSLKYIFLGMLFALIALFSKSNGMALLALVPVFLFYVNAKPKIIIISFLSIALMYLSFGQFQRMVLPANPIRIFEYFENPLMHEAWSIKRISASLYFSWFYLEMLIFPKNLSFYYGYNQIPIATWSYWQVWVSLIFYVSIGLYGLYAFIKKQIIGLAIIIWIGLMMGVNNAIFLLPGIVADRFAFSFSLGFSIVLVWLLVRVFKVDVQQGLKKIKFSNGLLLVFLSICLIYSARTLNRNPDWHDYLTLFEHDIEHLTESAKAHALISNTMYPLVAKETQQNPNSLNSNDVQKIIYHYKESIRIDSNYVTSINNLGSVYVNFLRDYESAINYCERAVELDSNYLEAHFNLAFSYQNIYNYEKSSYHYLKVIELNPDYLKAYDLYNQLLNKHNKVDEGILMLKGMAEKSLKPKSIYVNIGNLYSLHSNGDYKLSIEYFEKAYELDRSDKVLCSHIAKLYQLTGNIQKYNNLVPFCQ